MESEKSRKEGRPKRIAINTGGGDAPGLNAVIRAVVISADKLGWEVFGIKHGYTGLLDKKGLIRLTPENVAGITNLGGTILGTANKGNPFEYPYTTSDGKIASKDISDVVVQNFREMGFDVLVAVGGDGSLRIAYEFMKKGIPVVGVPKTIDNDLSETVITFGFDTAVTTATEAIDKLHSTAKSHDRVMVVEVMGRYAGWIALQAGLAGGGDVILIPEIPFTIDSVVEAVKERAFRGRTFTLIVIAEGARAQGGERFVSRVVEDSTDSVRLGGAGYWLSAELEKRLDREVRGTVLGHLQRGGSPTPFDRILATRYGVHAANCAAQGVRQVMVALKGMEITTAPLAEAVAQLRLVDPESQIVRAARAVGTRFGDE